MITDAFILQLLPTDTGLSLSAQLKDLTNTNVGSAITTGFTERARGEYVWVHDFADDFNGYIEFRSTGNVYQTTARYRATTPIDLTEISESLEDIQLALSATEITVSSPVPDASTIELVRGDDYPIGRISFALAQPDLTGAAVVFSAKNNQTGSIDLDAIACTISNPGESNQSISFVLTSAQTSTLMLGTDAYLFDLQATSAGKITTLARGSMNVIEDVSSGD